MQPTSTSRAKHNVLTSCKFSTGTKARSRLRLPRAALPIALTACRLRSACPAREPSPTRLGGMARCSAFSDVGFAPFLSELCLDVTRQQNNANVGFSLFFLPACVGISAITKGRLGFETGVFSAKSADSTGFRRNPLTSVCSFSMKETGYSLLFCTRFEAEITWK